MKVGKAIEVLEGIALMDKITPEIDEAVTTVVDCLRHYKFGDDHVPTRERQRGRDIIDPVVNTAAQETMSDLTYQDWVIRNTAAWEEEGYSSGS